MVKFHTSSFALMSPHNRPLDESNNNKKTSKVIAAVPITGILVAAAVLSGLLSVIGTESAIAQQQNMTGTNATTAGNVTAANATAMNATAGNVTAANATGITGG